MIRAYETACLIRGHRNIPIIRDERLREICFGENEGRVVADLLAERENTFRYFFDKPQLYVAPEHGESLEQLCERAKQFLETVKKLKAKKEVKERITKEINRFKNTVGSPAESGVIRTYIETLLSLPWDKTSRDNKNLQGAYQILEEEH